MNICYISNSAAPSKNASSLQTANLCAELVKQGHKVQLILPNTGLNKNYFKYYGIKNYFKILKLKKFNKFPRGLYYYLYSIFSVSASNPKKQDLYITRNYFTLFILVLLKKKSILEIHNDLKIEGRIIKLIVKFTKYLNSKFILNIITTTKSLKKKFVNDYGVNKNKIKVLHNTSSLSFRFKETPKRKKRINIAYFGSIYSSRGIDLFLELSKIDLKNNYFLFGGSSIEILKLKEKFDNKNLFLNSYQPYSEIKKYINKVDVALLPYTSKITVSGNVGDISLYTSPLKIFDFMKAGKLILCSDLKVIREILVNNHNSLLIKNFKNKKIWLNKIRLISTNFKKYDKIRLNAFNYAKKYNQNWRVKKLLTF